ncbi:MAG: class I SAM-dependent methyltransferase [Eubacteriales bacterium]|nr:class I SAM-dependent methyltransferase [Eubacteriales bacterium]
MQHIGNVTIDDTYYPGEDLYSDGPVEEELLEIARTHSEEELNSVIADRKSWPVLYHFSHIRQNILEWIPFKKSDKVLEIGAGCGAITGAIAKKAGSVTCIDLSMMRSRINAYRNQEYDNVRIMVGNFLTIEEKLTETYDYITLIGVFEYAEGYMGSEDPYRKMLRCIGKHLAPGGKIIIAIENRLGLKYWAGATEDHFGVTFAGLEGYPHHHGVKTFSRKELSDMLCETGDYDQTFYYPYPDYKLPMTIYSDKKLPEIGELTSFAPNYDRARLALFSEPNAWNSILEAGLFPEFSNSFLVVAERRDGDKKETETPEYIKYSNERSRTCAIRTDILEENHTKKVRKAAMYPEGRAHLQNLNRMEQMLNEQYQSAGFVCNRSTPEENGISLEFVAEETLEKQLDSLLKCGKVSRAKELFVDYLRKIESAHKSETFRMTREFQEVFGDVSLSEDLVCGKVTNIDLVCENLVLTTPPTVLDYEWTYDFPVPAQYVLYRVIHYFFADKKYEELNPEEFFEMFGIDEQKQEVYRKMEASFQKSLTKGHTPIRELHEEISPGIHKVTVEPIEHVQVFYAFGEGYTEEHSEKYLIEDQKVNVKISLPEGCTDLRVDPGNFPCMTYLRELSFDGEKADLSHAVVPNGTLTGSWLCCPSEDPNISLIPVPEGAKTLTLKLAIFPNDHRALEKTLQLEEENRRLRQEVTELRNPIYWKMKHTYDKLRERK